jgi:hypothetical protein
MPTTVTLAEIPAEEARDSDRRDSIRIAAAQRRRVACSTFVDLARRMGIRTDDAIRQFVDLR